MPRLNRFQIMQHVKPLIIKHLKSLNQNIFSITDIQSLLSSNKEKWTIPKITTVTEFISFLKEKQILREIEIDAPQRKITKYVFGETSPFEIAVSLRKGSYLSHYSALFLHQLTLNVPKTLYTNLEQSPKFNYITLEENELSQKNIDLAFSRPMRQTNQIATFEWEGKKHKVYLLNGKHQQKLGVKTIEAFELLNPIEATSIERTLIDSVVRPSYSGGVEEVLQAFEAAKGKFSVNRMLSHLKKMDYQYPYHQLIGFYLEKAGYEEKVLNLFNKFEKEYDFYLTYQIKDKNYSERWKVYYPKDL